jgi:hypothetical protein
MAKQVKSNGEAMNDGGGPKYIQRSLPNCKAKSVSGSNRSRTGLPITRQTIAQLREQKGYNRNVTIFAEQIDFFGVCHIREMALDTNANVSSRLFVEWGESQIPVEFFLDSV